MIKVRKGTQVVLGLSDVNMKRLAEDAPIKFALKDIIQGMPLQEIMKIDVIIFNGRTEESMALTIKNLATPPN